MWFIAGIMIMVMGIVAVYVGSIFDEVKRRPSYLIGETLNVEQ
jgi:dolichol-phosphate mannosyltransferase